MCKARHLVMEEPSMHGPGKTRCGLKVSDRPGGWFWNNRYKKDIAEVTCERCLHLVKFPVGKRKRNTIRVIDGKRIPKSSIDSLERPLTAPNYENSPRPGPPYPWEIANGMGCTGD